LANTQALPPAATFAASRPRAAPFLDYLFANMPLLPPNAQPCAWGMAFSRSGHIVGPIL